VTTDIKILPDDALLKIFDFIVDDNDSIDAWHALVHVCQKWRSIVFDSPRRLKLHPHCTAERPQAVKELLDIWPDLPIVIKLCDPPTSWGVDVVSPPLAHTDSVCEISLEVHMVAISPLDVIFAAMQVPFPASIRVKFLLEYEAVPIAPDDSFLDGPSPHLKSLYLGRVPFPGLPKLLLFTTDLVRLTLHRIPQSGYFSPEAMVTCLSTLTSLESFRLEFESPRPRPIQGRGRPPQQTFSALPALTHFSFRGVSEYLEDLVARIDAPVLHELYITFFHQLILDTPELAQFIIRTPNLKAFNEAQVMFLEDAVQVLLGSMQQFLVQTTCKAPDWQLSFVAQVCNSSLPLIPSLEHLYIYEGKNSPSRWPNDIENDQWLELLYLFTNAKSLYLSEEVVPRIAPALKELVERRVTKILPRLDNLFLEEPHPSGLVDESYMSKLVQEAIGIFITARQLSKSRTNSRNWGGNGTSVISQRFKLNHSL
jgi:hypothetical protein